MNDLDLDSNDLLNECTSNKIQNEIIELITEDVRDRTIAKIRNNGLFSSSSDKTTHK